MDPFSLIFSGLKIAGSIYSGFANAGSAKQSKITAELNASLLRTAADVSREAAKYELLKGETQAAQIAEGVRRAEGAQTAVMASSNLDPTWGSPLVWQAETVRRGVMDQALVRASAGIAAADRRVQAANLDGQAVGADMQASAADAAGTASLVKGFLGAGEALLQPQLWSSLTSAPTASASSGFVDPAYWSGNAWGIR